MTVMRKHQRYFPVCDAGGGLLPAFVTVANGPVDVPTVRAGAPLSLRSPAARAAPLCLSTCCAWPGRPLLGCARRAFPPLHKLRAA